MKTKILVLLIITILLSYLDGLLTYLGITYGWSIEINPIIRMFHLILGLNNWLLLHVVIGSVLGLILYFLKNRATRIIEFWFGLETLIFCVHITGLIITFLK